MAQALFIGGTSSHAGKSWFTAAFCRMLARRGVRVAPFKAQNMSNNSYPCIEGGEIGRSQAMQAEACGLPAMADMNPVLLKPNSATGSQVVLNGRVWQTLEARAYYNHTDQLLQLAVESFGRLAAQFDQIVCEGAGSVAEVNLWDRDITNLRLAEAVGARGLLVASIEKGGVFGSLVGTIELLSPEKRALLRAFAVNRFRGDRTLFDDGVRFLEQRLGIPCLGVFPYEPAIVLDEEDSVSLDEVVPVESDIAVVRLPRISNFTDFRELGPVEWIAAPRDKQFRVVFIPGTKNTIEDLLWLREMGLDSWVREQRAGGALIVGICGGYQMLGEQIDDPDGVESGNRTIAGLGLLPVRTVMRAPKVTRVVEARTAAGEPFRAYEIHMGETSPPPRATPFAWLADGSPEGCCVTGVVGTYLHGAFESAAVVREVLSRQIAPPAKEAMYNRLADWLEEYSRRDVLEALVA